MRSTGWRTCWTRHLREVGNIIHGMKTWLTYLAAAAMGLAFQATFKESSFFYSSMNFMASIVLKLGVFIVFPLVLFAMTSGTSSLARKKGENGFVWLSSFFWSLLTTVTMSIAAALVFKAVPASFPLANASSVQGKSLCDAFMELTSNRLSLANPLSANAFLNLVKSSDSLLPVMFLAVVFGYAIRPTSEVMRPAYQVLNSISEAMFRLARQTAKVLWIAVFFVAGTWCETLWLNGTVFSSWRFITMLCVAGFGTFLIIVPLIYAIATGFKRNPYRQITRLLSAATAAFFSVNSLFAMPALYTDCRINLGIRKNVVSTSIPIHSILTKGGSAMMGTLCSCSLVLAATGAMPTILETVTIALACTAVSFVSSLHSGYEVLFCVSCALGLLGKDVAGGAESMIGMLPLVNGMALLFDTLLSGLGTSFTACNLGADCNIVENDTV